MFPPRRPSLHAHAWRRTAPALRRPAGHAMSVVVGVIGLCLSLYLVQLVDVAVAGSLPRLQPTAAELVGNLPPTAAGRACPDGAASAALVAACAQPADLFEVPPATAEAIQL